MDWNLLVACLRIRASSNPLVVIQSPDVTVTEGEAVDINCCWTESLVRARVRWLKNQTLIKEELINQSERSLNEQEKKCSTLNIPILPEADGRYVCELFVEIPLLSTTKGNGTVITVTARENQNRKKVIATGKGAINPVLDNVTDDTFHEDVLIHVLRCLPVLALIIAFFWIYSLGTKAQRNAQEASRNVPTSPQSIEEVQEEKREEDQVQEEADERATEPARGDS